MKVLPTICLAVAGCFCASTASALVVAEEYMFSFGPEPTPWDTSFEVPLYDGVEPLAEVMITLDGIAESDVELTANGGDVTVIEGEVGAFITATSGAVGLNIDALPNGVFAPPLNLVPDGTTENLIDVAGADSDMETLTGSPAVDPYIGAGTFTVEVSALGTSTLTTSGGNLDFSQVTTAGATLTVQYKVEEPVIPEPSSLLILATGLAGVLVRRRG